MSELRLAWCSHDAARFAVLAWHYSRALPTGKLVKVGGWEDGRFIGCVIFSRGAARHIGTPFGLRQSEVCELTRVALAQRQTATSRIVAIALRLLRQQSPGLRLVVSYADPEHQHVGTIYQAGGWIYVGTTGRECHLRVLGRLQHPRTVASRWGHRGVSWLRQHVDPDVARIPTAPKHKYLYAFDADLRARLLTRAQPYPKRGRSRDSAAAGPPAEGGVIPTRPLHPDHCRA